MLFNPYLEIILAATIWGTTGIFVKFLNLPSTTITFFRLAAPTIILLLYFSHKQTNLVKKASKIMLFISVLNAARMFLYFVAFISTSVGNAVIMLYTWPVFAVLLSPLLLKEKLTNKKLFLSLLAFVGIVIMFANKEFSFANKDFMGMTAMLVASSFTALMFLLFKKQLVHYSNTETIFYQNVLGAIVFLPFLFINKPVPTFNQSVIASLYATFSGLIGFLLYFAGLKQINASTAALLSYSEVISAVFLGAVFLREGITLNMVIGGGIILVVSYLARRVDAIPVSE